MQSRQRSMILAVTLVAGGLLCSRLVHSQGVRGTSLKPFVAYEKEQSFANDGQLRTTSDRIVAHREDGSYVIAFTTHSPAGETATHRTIVDVSAGKHVFLEPFTQSAMTFYLSDDELRQMTQSEKACEDGDIKTQLSSKSAKSSIMFNQEVRWVSRKLGRDTTIGAWVAPDLDCLALSETQSFGIGSRNEISVERIDIGNPPDSLFEVPAEYAEHSPAEIEAAYRAKYPGHIFFGDDPVKVLEQRYRSHRR